VFLRTMEAFGVASLYYCAAGVREALCGSGRTRFGRELSVDVTGGAAEQMAPAIRGQRAATREKVAGLGRTLLTGSRRCTDCRMLWRRWKRRPISTTPVIMSATPATTNTRLLVQNADLPDHRQRNGT